MLHQTAQVDVPPDLLTPVSQLRRGPKWPPTVPAGAVTLHRRQRTGDSVQRHASSSIRLKPRSHRGTDLK